MKNSSKNKIHNISISAVMGAIGAVLMFLELSLPIIPSFVKLDFSEIPALIATFALGPVYGVAVCLIKNVIHLFVTQSAGIGELANFLLGASFVFTTGLIYKKNKNRRTALLSCLVGTVVMAVFSIAVNYFISYPFYIKVYFGGDVSTVIAMYKAILPSVNTLLECLIIFNIPFTFFKGIIDGIVCFAIYKKLSPILKGEK